LEAYKILLTFWKSSKSFWLSWLSVLKEGQKIHWISTVPPGSSKWKCKFSYNPDMIAFRVIVSLWKMPGFIVNFFLEVFINPAVFSFLDRGNNSDPLYTVGWLWNPTVKKVSDNFVYFSRICIKLKIYLLVGNLKCSINTPCSGLDHQIRSMTTSSFQIGLHKGTFQMKHSKKLIAFKSRRNSFYLVYLIYKKAK